MHWSLVAVLVGTGIWAATAAWATNTVQQKGDLIVLCFGEVDLLGGVARRVEGIPLGRVDSPLEFVLLYMARDRRDGVGAGVAQRRLCVEAAQLTLGRLELEQGHLLAAAHHQHVSPERIQLILQGTEGCSTGGVVTSAAPTCVRVRIWQRKIK